MGELEDIPNHQVKVDNWPLFFLQRLQHFYRKKSHCDLTLLFSTLDTVKSIKVHKLVLYACTDYFESLDVMKDSEHGEFLQLSNEMHPDVVIPIISFMYTGKLEFPVTLQPKLYEAATKLRMTIITKLLDVQPNKDNKKSALPSGDAATKVSVLKKETVFQQANDVQDLGSASAAAAAATSQITTTPSTPSSSKSMEEVIYTLVQGPMANSQNKQPSKKDLTIVQASDISGLKTNNQVKAKVLKNMGLQFTTVRTKPKVVDVSLPPTLPGRKLPVWKRKVPFTGSPTVLENVQNVCRRGSLREPELAKPTRFEWEEDLNDPSDLRPVEDALKTLSHDTVTKIVHPIVLEGDSGTYSKETSGDSGKRSSDRSCSESPPYKRSKSDLQDMKEYGKQQQLRNEIICSEENSEDMMDTDDIYGPCDDSDDVSGFNQANVNSSTPKPILKTVSKPEPPKEASKRVRFSLEGKENNQKKESTGDFTTTKQTDTSASKQKIVMPMDVGQMQSGKHHLKIVSEVLKKYPNLAKRENIKLRVVSKNPAAVPPRVQEAVEGNIGSGNKSNSLVSYIFLTNKGSGDFLTVREDSDEKGKFDVENKTGPWFCQVCDEGNPIEFDSYYSYRRHLVEVHELKIDARICEYCGMKNSKRNQLLYHLYTKHGIDPPAHVSFPKCPDCDYIAPSDSLFLKHKRSHDAKGLTCDICNVTFKSYSSMQLHLESTWHKGKLNEVSAVYTDYPCPFCEARFNYAYKLKHHIEMDHHSQKASQRERKQIYRCPYCEGLFGDGDRLGKHIISVHWGKNNQVSIQETREAVYEAQSGQQLQYSEDTEDFSETIEHSENQPSSELESLSNVASGIATSLSLVGNEQTVVYYEQRTEGQDIGREATVVSGDECKDYIISAPPEDLDRECQETEMVNIENEDSNSRTSNTEEVNPTSCSDHDYSEPQVDEGLRQVIPVHQVAGPISESPVIQQILPDQRLVFSNQPNVVFQPPCVGVPQRVLFSQGKVVLPQIAHGDQNVILSQVIPQTRFILSNPILPPGGIIENGSRTILFANPEVANAMENIQAVPYPIQTVSENEEASDPEKPIEEIQIVEEGSQEVETRVDEQEDVMEEEQKDIEVIENSEDTSQDTNDVEDVEHASVSDAPFEDSKLRIETAKIVDDWDETTNETNESQQNAETRNDGPSRPEFF